MKMQPVPQVQPLRVVEPANAGSNNSDQSRRKNRHHSRKSKKYKADPLLSFEATPFGYRLISRAAYRFAEIRDDGVVVVVVYIALAHMGTYIWMVLSPELNWFQAILGTVFAGWFISLFFLLPAWIFYLCVVTAVALCSFAAQRVAKWKKWEIIQYEMDAYSGSVFSDVLFDAFVVGVLSVLTLGLLFSDDC